MDLVGRSFRVYWGLQVVWLYLYYLTFTFKLSQGQCCSFTLFNGWRRKYVCTCVAAKRTDACVLIKSRIQDNTM